MVIERKFGGVRVGLSGRRFDRREVPLYAGRRVRSEANAKKRRRPASFGMTGLVRASPVKLGQGSTVLFSRRGWILSNSRTFSPRLGWKLSLRQRDSAKARLLSYSSSFSYLDWIWRLVFRTFGSGGLLRFFSRGRRGSGRCP